MDEKIRQHRIKAARNALAITRMEPEHANWIPDPQHEVWTEMWINQEITSKQLHDLVLEDIKRKYCNKEKITYDSE